MLCGAAYSGSWNHGVYDTEIRFSFDLTFSARQPLVLQLRQILRITLPIGPDALPVSAAAGSPTASCVRASPIKDNVRLVFLYRACWKCGIASSGQ